MSGPVLEPAVGPTLCVEVVGIDKDALSESAMEAVESAVFDLILEQQGHPPREVVVKFGH